MTRASGRLAPGERVGDRFVVERHAASGGAGAVYLARDELTGDSVALKLITEPGYAGARFAREARLLCDLSHPHVVRYVAHGVTPDGRPYLSTEWLEGEDLRRRLARGPLTVSDTVALARRVAGALGAAHDKGIVHRDVKPGNLFLPGGRVRDVKVIDFGIAALPDASLELTPTGGILGTPGYIAPEIASAVEEVDARADVFSLGCVLFHCLSGRRAFEGKALTAVLAAIVFGDAPSLEEVRPGLAPALVAVVDRMLSRDRRRRFADGHAIVEALRDIEVSDDEVAPIESEIPPAITTDRQALFGVVVCAPPRGVDHAPDAATLRRLADHHGARLATLGDGSLVFAFPATSTATDLASRAARCSLGLARVHPGRIAVATGRARVSGGLPIGAAVERATDLLELTPALSASAGLGVTIDALTAGLLPPRFVTVDHGDGATLVREQRRSPPRTVLGRPSPFVGREVELSVLRSVVDASRDEGAPRAALVVGAAGSGKSRIVHELLAEIEHADAPPAVWVGRGDPLRAGSAFVLAAEALRHASALAEHEGAPIQRRMLRARIDRAVAPEARDRVVDFLSELLGVARDSPGPQLAAAREDPVLMGDQVRRAYLELLAAECEARPVVIVLEDLHWGDRPSLDLFRRALVELEGRPLTVVAAARPEVRDALPDVATIEGLVELRLPRLSRKRSAQVVEAILESPDADVVERIVARADGNPFFLEELVRAEAQGRTPDAVLATVQARLDASPEDARRVQRAASVLGPGVWPGAVTSLLGGDLTRDEVERWLAELVRTEVMVERGASRFVGETEFAFRHALVREAAYATLSSGDRRVGHRLAADWLEAAGVTDAGLLAGHRELADQPALAVDCWERAARAALEADDLAATIECGERAIACGAEGAQRGRVRLAQAEASKWRGDWAGARPRAQEAMALLEPGTREWALALTESAVCAQRLGRYDELKELARRLLEAVDEDAARELVSPFLRVALGLLYASDAELAQRLRARIEGADGGAPGHLYDSLFALHAGDVEGYLSANRRALDAMLAMGDRRRAVSAQTHIGFALMELGGFGEAESMLREAWQTAEAMGLDSDRAVAMSNFGYAVAQLGDAAEGVRLQHRAIEVFDARGERRNAGSGWLYVALLDVERDPAAALDAARRAEAMLEDLSPGLLPYARAARAVAHLALGQSAEARDAAGLAQRAIEEGALLEAGRALVRLTWARALDACGERAAAVEAIGAAAAELDERAAAIRDDGLRRGFLERVPENRMTLELAREWGAAEA